MPGDFDGEIHRLRSELIEIRVRFWHKEKELFERTQELEVARNQLSKQDGELKRTIQELNTLNTTFEVQKERLRRREEELVERDRKVAKKKTAIRLQAVLTSMLFLLSTVLASFGVNMLTATTPNQAGWIMIALASIAYLIATLITFLLTTEGSN